MKIIHIAWSLGVGGIETMLVNIANTQAEMGEYVTIIIVNKLYDDSLLSRISGKVELIMLNRNGHINPIPFIKLNYLLLQRNPDVIHCHHDNMINVLWSGFRKKCCYTQHCVYPQGLLSRQQLIKYNKIFAISKSVADNILCESSIESTVVDNGINIDEIISRSYRKLRKEDVFHFVTVGRLLISEKGQDVLLNAIAHLANYNIKLDIIGEGPDKDVLDKLIKDLSLEDKACLKGKYTQEKIFCSLCHYDAFILPSRTEGFGLSVVEAMAAKLPVIVSDIEGPREIVQDGKYGHLFEVGNTDSCAKAIKALIDNYDREEQIIENYEYISSNYSVRKTAREYLNYYKEIVK